MKSYTLTVARPAQPSDLPIIVVKAPWDHFSHILGAPEYCRQVAKAKCMPVVVAQDPQEQWHCDEVSAHLWKLVLANTTPEKLAWHTMQVKDGESPDDQMKEWIRRGIR